MAAIAYLDFWPGFNPEEDFFTEFLRQGQSGVHVSRPSVADVIVFSCFGERHLEWLGSGKKLVFYTGENERPRTYADLNLTFDEATEHRNLRLPIWIRHLSWFGKTSWGSGWAMPRRFLTEPIAIAASRRNRFAAILATNGRLERLALMRAVGRFGRVDSWGSTWNNMGRALGGTEYRKFQILRRYRYNLCPENSYYPGYTTEKAIHSWAAGAVPIYSGGYLKNEIDERSFLKVMDVEELADLDTRKFFEQPLIKSMPTEESVYQIVSGILI